MADLDEQRLSAQERDLLLAEVSTLHAEVERLRGSQQIDTDMVESLRARVATLERAIDRAVAGLEVADNLGDVAEEAGELQAARAKDYVKKND